MGQSVCKRFRSILTYASVQINLTWSTNYLYHNARRTKQIFSNWRKFKNPEKSAYFSFLFIANETFLLIINSCRSCPFTEGILIKSSPKGQIKVYCSFVTWESISNLYPGWKRMKRRPRFYQLSSTDYFPADLTRQLAALADDALTLRRGMLVCAPLRTFHPELIN